MPPRLVKLALRSDAKGFDLAASLADRPLRHLELLGGSYAGSLAGLTSLRSLEITLPEDGLPIEALLALPRLRVLRVDPGLIGAAEHLARRARAEQGRRIALQMRLFKPEKVVPFRRPPA